MPDVIATRWPSWLGLLGLGVVVGCAGRTELDATQRDQRAAALEVEVSEARLSSISETLELVGSFLPRRRTVLVSEVEGVIKRIAGSQRTIQIQVDGQTVSEPLGLDIGQEVNQGDILVELDPTDFQLALALAEAKLAREERELERLLAWKRPEEVARLQALRQEAAAHQAHTESELKRAEAMRTANPGAISAREYDTYEAEARRARALLAHAEASLKIATAGPVKEEVAVAKARVAEARAEVNVQQQNLQKATVRAPYDAVITDRYADRGDRVTPLPRFELMEIMDLSVVLAQVGVAERYIHQVHVGDGAAVRVAGTAEPLAGMVVHVNDKVDPETRTFRVRVAVANRPRRFKVGQFVHVVFRIGGADPALVVPTQAVTYAGGQPLVFVVADGHAAARQVTVGLVGDGRVEIRTGLKPGDQVVVDDPALLADGMPARVRKTATVDRLSRRDP